MSVVSVAVPWESAAAVATVSALSTSSVGAFGAAFLTMTVCAAASGAVAISSAAAALTRLGRLTTSEYIEHAPLLDDVERDVDFHDFPADLVGAGRVLRRLAVPENDGLVRAKGLNPRSAIAVARNFRVRIHGRVLDRQIELETPFLQSCRGAFDARADVLVHGAGGFFVDRDHRDHHLNPR